MKRTLTFLLTIFITASLSAQRFSGGLIAGFNGSQVDGDTYSGYNKAGLALGAFASTNFSDKFSGELQIKFMQKGAKKKITENDLSQYTSKLNYIEIPILFRFHQTKKISWHAGPAFGYLFKYSVENENGSLNEDDISFRKFEISGIAGFQYQIIEKIGVSVSFSYSLIPISESAVNPTYYRPGGLYNNLVSIMLSYKI